MDGAAAISDAGPRPLARLPGCIPISRSQREQRPSVQRPEQWRASLPVGHLLRWTTLAGPISIDVGAPQEGHLF
jgi:hypothetical protein